MDRLTISSVLCRKRVDVESPFRLTVLQRRPFMGNGKSMGNRTIADIVLWETSTVPIAPPGHVKAQP